MHKENLQEYHDLYISNYLPYKDSDVYKSLMRVVYNHYLDDLYNNIPHKLKHLFETGEIPYELLDKLLIQIGVSQRLINDLNDWEKSQFLKYLSNFQREKGNVNLLKRAFNLFNSQISVYELFISYSDGQWVFKPKPLYQVSQGTTIEQNINYYDIYHASSNFFIDVQLLSNLKATNQIILPFKTNLLLLDFANTEDISIINDLAIASFLYEYGDTILTITFDDEYFNISIELLTHVWFYLITIYYNHIWDRFPETRLLHYDSSQIGFPHRLSDIDKLIDQINSIGPETNSARRDLDNIYFNEFIKHYDTYRESPTRTRPDGLNNFIRNRDSSLARYLRNSVDNNPTEITERYISELYHVLQRYINQSDDEQFKKYGLMWLQYLPKLTLNIEETTEYKILQEIKPFRIETVNYEISGMTVDNKFENIFMDVDDFEIDFAAGPYTSSLVMSDSYEFVEDE